MQPPVLRHHRRLLMAGAIVLGLTGTAGQAVEIDFRFPAENEGLADALRAASILREAKRDDQSADALDLFASARAEYGRLLGALYAEGYYSGVIHVLVDGREAATIPPLDAPDQINQIVVTVDPGPPFTFSRAQIAPLAKGPELPGGFAAGKRARSGTIRDAVTAGVDGWRAKGHAKTAVAAQDLTADHPNAMLSADVALAPGPRLRFGPLRVEGEQRMRENRIRKIAGLPDGKVYDPEELQDAAERLRRTGVFRSVTLTEDETITPPDLLGITATLVEEKTRRYSVGAEIASLDGVSVNALWMHRNLLGGAERLTVEGSVTNIGAQSSGVDYRLGVKLDRPATFTPDTSLGFAAEIGHVDEQDYTADLASVSVNLAHVFSDRLTGTLGLTYAYSEGRDQADDFRFQNLALPLGAVWDSRDSIVDATKGYYLDAEARPFLGFDTTDSGLRLTLDARAYRGFGAENRFVLAGRLQVGAVYGASLLGTPRDYLFYSGGGGTVRGQPYQSLGILVTRGLEDIKIGGNFFLGTSVEARTKVTDKIGVVGFVDAGRIAVGDFFDASGDWHAGAGLGLRYDTGFGPIRLDVATPIGGEGEGVQIYVGLGQSF